MSRNNKIAVQVLGLCVAAVMIIYGVSRGETVIMFNKAVNICPGMYWVRISGDMKINQEMKRKIVQVAAFGYSNTYIGNFVSGQIYKGRWKQFCNPGTLEGVIPLSCKTCLFAEHWGSSGSMNFKLSF